MCIILKNSDFTDELHEINIQFNQISFRAIGSEFKCDRFNKFFQKAGMFNETDNPICINANRINRWAIRADTEIIRHSVNIGANIGEAKLTSDTCGFHSLQGLSLIRVTLKISKRIVPGKKNRGEIRSCKKSNRSK